MAAGQSFHDGGLEPSKNVQLVFDEQEVQGEADDPETAVAAVSSPDHVMAATDFIWRFLPTHEETDGAFNTLAWYKTSVSLMLAKHIKEKISRFLAREQFFFAQNPYCFNVNIFTKDFLAHF